MVLQAVCHLNAKHFFFKKKKKKTKTNFVSIWSMKHSIAHIHVCRKFNNDPKKGQNNMNST